MINTERKIKCKFELSNVNDVEGTKITDNLMSKTSTGKIETF